MSAYLVNQDTINLLASAALDPMWRGHGAHTSGVSVYAETGHLKCHTREARDLVRPDGWSKRFEVFEATYSDGDTLARELAAANYFSMIARYPKEHDLATMYEYAAGHSFQRISAAEATRLDVLGAINCYRYQSCEAGDEYDRLWGRFCQALERRVVSELPGVGWEYKRPESAPVSIFELSQKGK
jgi:hypothetical protein